MVRCTLVAMRSFVAIVLIATLAACGDDDGPPPGSNLPATWTISGPGITVEIRRAPYGLSIRDAAGTERLASIAEPRDGGYAPLAWTTGQTRWRPGGISKGYYTFSSTLDPWRDDWLVVEAEASPDRLVLVLRDNGTGSARMVVEHVATDHALRVAARLEGGEPRAWSAAFATPPDEGFLGFGERFNKTNQRGVEVYSWAEEGGFGTGEGTVAGPMNPSPNGEAMAYYPVPFFVSTRGYAFWLDSTWRNEFELATAHDDAWRVWDIGPSLAFEVFLPKEDARPWPYRLIDAFTARVGRPMLPPAWTYGPRRRVNRNDVQMGVSEIQAMRDLDLAITAVDDSMHFLPKGNHVGIEEELRAWVAEGHRLSYRMNGYYNSLLAAGDTPLRDVVAEGVAAGHFLLGPDGQPSEVELISGEYLTVYQVDFTSDAATAWYQRMFDWATSLGYDGFMYDFGEYVQPNSVASNGMTGEELHNLYPVLYQRAAHDHFESGPRAGDWLAFARSGYTGAWQYVPMIWGGDPAASFEDSDGLPSMIRAGVNLGVVGAANWGGDIGGFHCAADGYAAADGELMTRWIQQGSMTPNMQDQDACVLALDTGEKASIWSSPEAMEAWRTYARLHTRLFPYLYTLAHEANATGAPLMRHPFLEHPDRPELASVDDAYYFGPAIYVAPVVERGAVTKTVLLPPGQYLDWAHETVIAGGAEVTIDAPLALLPLLLRAGHLVPMLDPTIDTLTTETNPDVVGPDDVADVYDVVAFLTRESASDGASFDLWNGERLEATYTAAFAPPALPEATDPAELATCATGCYRRDALAGGVSRIRITAPAGTTVTAGGLTLASTSTRRIRWDLYVVD